MEFVKPANRRSLLKLGGITITFRNECMAAQTKMKTEFCSIHLAIN